MQLDQRFAMIVSIASLAVTFLIATADGLAVESRPALPATIHSVVRRYHNFPLNSVPGPSAPFGLFADANSITLAFASITAAADELAIELRPMPLAAFQPVVHRHHNLDLGSVPSPSTPFDLATGANGTFHAIASTTATSNGLAIESPPTSRTSARPAVRHHHDFDLNSVPKYSAPSDLLASADHTFLTIASITAAADELAIEPRPAPLVTLHPVVHPCYHDLLDLNSVPGPCARSDLAAGADDIPHTVASTISVAAIVAIATGGNITRAHDRAPLVPSAPSALFSSRHATSIAIRQVLPSTADADGPTDTTSDPTRRYRRETAQISSKSKNELFRESFPT